MKAAFFSTLLGPDYSYGFETLIDDILQLRFSRLAILKTDGSVWAAESDEVTSERVFREAFGLEAPVIRFATDWALDSEGNLFRVSGCRFGGTDCRVGMTAWPNGTFPDAVDITRAGACTSECYLEGALPLIFILMDDGTVWSFDPSFEVIDVRQVDQLSGVTAFWSSGGPLPICLHEDGSFTDYEGRPFTILR